MSRRPHSGLGRVQARQALRQGQGGHHAPGHRPAVGQAEAGGLLQAVAQGVAEVEDAPEVALPLVLGHHLRP